MKKKFKIEFHYFAELIILINTLLIVLLLGTSVFNINPLIINNNSITTNNIIATILFVVIITFKNVHKLKITKILERFTPEVLIFMIVYNISTFSLILLMIFLGNVNIFLGIILILLEIIILLINFYANYNKKMNRNLLKLEVFKEYHCNVMIIVLLMNNYPFDIINIPFSSLLVIFYIILQINIIYSYFE